MKKKKLNRNKRRGKAKDKVTVILVKNTLSDVIILRNKRCTWLCFFCTKKCNDFFGGLRPGILTIKSERESSTEFLDLLDC